MNVSIIAPDLVKLNYQKSKRHISEIPHTVIYVMQHHVFFNERNFDRNMVYNKCKCLKKKRKVSDLKTDI